MWPFQATVPTGRTRTKKGKISEKVIASAGFDDYYDVFGD